MDLDEAMRYLQSELWKTLSNFDENTKRSDGLFIKVYWLILRICLLTLSAKGFTKHHELKSHKAELKLKNVWNAFFLLSKLSEIPDFELPICIESCISQLESEDSEDQSKAIDILKCFIDFLCFSWTRTNFIEIT